MALTLNSRPVKQFSAEALESLRRMPWRGNVRELKNAVERVSIFTHHSQISTEDLQVAGIGVVSAEASTLTAALQRHLRSSKGGRDLLGDIEKRLVELAMLDAGGNVSRAARLLGIDRMALQRRCEKFGITSTQDTPLD